MSESDETEEPRRVKRETTLWAIWDDAGPGLVWAEDYALRTFYTREQAREEIRREGHPFRGLEIVRIRVEVLDE